MTPKTQSVCKHCRRPKCEHDGIALFCRTKSVYQYEPVAEPASTGEPPPKYWLVLFEDAGLAQQFELFTDESAARKRHQALLLNWNCHLFTEAARPSEPTTESECSFLSSAGAKPCDCGEVYPEPAAPQTSAEPKKQCGCVHGDSDPYCPDPLCPNYIAAYHVEPAAPSYMTCTECGMNVCDHIVKRLAGDAPKVEEIALKVCQEVYGPYMATVDAKHRQKAIDGIAAILRPYYFPPASQTPKPTKEARQVAERFLMKELGFAFLAQNRALTVTIFQPKFRIASLHQLDKKWDVIYLMDKAWELLIKQQMQLLATPASTARTDGWVSVAERLPEDEDGYVDVAVDTKAMQNYADELPDLEMMPVDVANIIFLKAWAGKFITHWQKRPAAPGSVPPHDPEKDFRDKFIGNWEGVPQAEPPKEEKP